MSVSRGNPGQRTTGEKQAHFSGQTAEEVVILKRSQVRWLCSVTESGKQEAGASLRCREQQEHVSSSDVRTRASISAASKWLSSDDRTFKASYYISAQGSPIQP